MNTNNSEAGITIVLCFVCAVMIIAMALNAPSPNGNGGWRDQFVDAWNQAGESDQPGDETSPSPSLGSGQQDGP